MNFTEAYTLCREVLSQLGEDIPEALQSGQLSEMVEATSKMVATAYWQLPHSS